MDYFRCAKCGAFNRVKNKDGKSPVCGRCKEKLDVSGAPQQVTGAELERAVKGAPVPVLVDFWAAWCGPCRMAAPILDEIARSKAGEIVVLKLDTDANQDAARRHSVQGIPLFVMFREGQEAARQTGLPPKSAFKSWVESVA